MKLAAMIVILGDGPEPRDKHCLAREPKREERPAHKSVAKNPRPGVSRT